MSLNNFRLDAFGPRRGARLRKRVFEALVWRRKGDISTLSTLARRLHCHKNTVWRSILWLRTNGFIQTQRQRYGLKIELTVQVPLRRPSRTPTPVDRYTRLLKRAGKLGVIDQTSIPERVLDYALAVERRNLRTLI